MISFDALVRGAEGVAEPNVDQEADMCEEGPAGSGFFFFWEVTERAGRIG